MSTAQLAAVSFLARYSGHTHVLYAYQLRERFARQVLERDRSVGLVTDLADGQQAERASIDRPWERGPLTD